MTKMFVRKCRICGTWNPMLEAAELPAANGVRLSAFPGGFACVEFCGCWKSREDTFIELEMAEVDLRFFLHKLFRAGDPAEARRFLESAAEPV